MLHNMRNAGGIFRRRPESDLEDFVLVVIFDDSQPCAALFMFKLNQFRI